MSNQLNKFYLEIWSSILTTILHNLHRLSVRSHVFWHALWYNRVTFNSIFGNGSYFKNNSRIIRCFQYPAFENNIWRTNVAYGVRKMSSFKRMHIINHFKKVDFCCGSKFVTFSTVFWFRSLITAYIDFQILHLQLIYCTHSIYFTRWCGMCNGKSLLFQHISNITT